MVAEEPTRDMIEDLRESSSMIRILSESFANVSKVLEIVTCREMLETATTQLQDGQWKRTGPLEWMVTETSACLYLPNETRIPIYANHSMIAKLGDGPDSAYHTIKDHIARHVRFAPTVVQRRLLKADCVKRLSEIYQLAQFVYAIVCTIQQSPLPALEVKNSISDLVSFLQHFATFLYDDDLARVLEDPNLSLNHTEEVVHTLRQLSLVFSSYRGLATKYCEPCLDDKEMKPPIEEPGAHIDKGVLRIPTSEILQDPDSDKTLFQNDTLLDLVRQCRQSTRRLEITLAYARLFSLASLSDEESESSQRKIEMCGTASAKIAKRQHLLTRADAISEIEPLNGSLEEYDVPEGKSDLRFARFTPDGSTLAQEYIVEYRGYEPEPRVDGPVVGTAKARSEYLSKLKRSMRQLAALLRESSFEIDTLPEEGDSAPDSIGAFRCSGLVEERDRFRLAFLYDIPDGLTALSLGSCCSLSTYIEDYQLGEQLPAQNRLTIARVLCQNILNLHASGWVHKNIRSSNIILVPASPKNVLEDSRSLPHRYVQYLKGFEFSRPQLERSSGRANFDPSTNLYRHPERQNVPDTRFMKEHDLYAVGVVLLEIGLWETVTRLFQKHVEAARQNQPFPLPNTIRDSLLRRAGKISLGPDYSAAVTACLTGDFGVEKDNKQQANLGLAFRQQVLDVIVARSKWSDSV